MSTQELASRVLQILEQEPGLLGREVAELIDYDKKQTNGQEGKRT